MSAELRASILAAVAAIDRRAGQRLLDVGCGPGAHLGLCTERVAPAGRVVGLDSAADLRGNLVAADTVELRAGDMYALPCTGGEFDVTWTSFTLHHAERPGALLAELSRVVRPGGLVAVLDSDSGGSFPCVPWPPDLEQRRAVAWAALGANHDDKLPYLFASYVGRQLPRLLREAGLRDVHLYALADIDRAPLGTERVVELRRWFLRWYEERLRDFLPPRDGQRFTALFDPASPDYLLDDPDFFLSRTWFLATGRVR